MKLVTQIKSCGLATLALGMLAAPLLTPTAQAQKPRIKDKRAVLKDIVGQTKTYISGPGRLTIIVERMEYL